MEKGETAIVVGQFAALAIVILLLSNYLPIASATTTGIGRVYWGDLTTGVPLTKGGVNVEKTNASTISVLYTLSSGTQPSSVSAVRLCLDKVNETGSNLVYTDIQFEYSQAEHANYLSFGPAGQPPNLTCTYTISLTTTVEQTVTWSATVRVNSTAT